MPSSIRPDSALRVADDCGPEASRRSSRRKPALVRNLVRAALIAVVAAGVGSAAPAASGAGDPTVWLCQPGQADNPCDGPVDGTELAPPGMVDRPLGHAPASEPRTDCFYVYPTQSRQQTDNANLDKDPPIRRVAIQQARQFARVCRVFAPMYNQYPLSRLLRISDQMRDVAYAGVLAAWNEYLARYNDGRGVVLIGHSQGASHLARLVAERVDPVPAIRGRLVSAILPGANVYVPKGQAVGGWFQHVPACESPGQFGCVVAYSMMRAEPPAFSFFGRVGVGYWAIPGGSPDPGRYEVLCTDPARLDGGDGSLVPMINPGVDGTRPVSSEGPAPWISVPGYLRSECRSSGGANWLNVSRVAGPDDPRPDLSQVLARGNDLHGGDINLAEGNLVEMVALQIEARRVAGIRSRIVAARKRLKRALVRQRNAKAALTRARRGPGAGRARVRRARARFRAARDRTESVRREIRGLKRRLPAA